MKPSIEILSHAVITGFKLIRSVVLFLAFYVTAILPVGAQVNPAPGVIPATTVGAAVTNIINNFLLSGCNIPNYPDNECPNVIQTQAQVNEFAGVTQIEGNLVISGTTNLDFSPFHSLQEITGGLSFLYGNQNSIVGFNNLQTVGYGIDFENNRQVTTVDGFDSLTSVGPNASTNRNSRLFFTGNQALTQVSGFENLTAANYIRISGNPLLETIPRFNFLGSVVNLEFTDNPALQGIRGFNRLVTIGGSGASSFRITDNQGLTVISGFNSLDSASSIEVSSNQQLDSFTGFSSLREVERNLWVRFSDSLTRVPSFPALVSVNFLIFRELPSLATVSAFESLENVDRSIVLVNIGLLTNLSGFNNLISTRDLQISNHPELATISGFAQLSGLSGNLFVISNPKLTNVTGVNVLARGDVSDDVDIYYNDILDCPMQFGALQPASYSTGNAVNCSTQ